MPAVAKVISGGVVKGWIDRLIIHLPEEKGRVIFVAGNHFLGQSFCQFPVMWIIFADIWSRTVFWIKGSILSNRAAVWVFSMKPGWHLRSWNSKQYFQPMFCAKIHGMVKFGKGELPHLRLHPVPGHFPETNGIQSNFLDLFESLIPGSFGPLVGVIGYAKRDHFFKITLTL